MEYRYHYTMEYLPTRYEANSREWDNRHAVWNFKDGACSNSILNDMSETINDIVNGRESEYVICFIPASTKSKTINRFATVARKLTERTGVRATLSGIYKTSDSESGYIAGKSSNPTTDFCFDSSVFRGKKVITRGRTFVLTADKMMANGATSVEGLFVAKTINPDWNTMVA